MTKAKKYASTEANENQAKTKPLHSFFFPTHDVSIKAATYEEAKKELERRLNPTS